MLSRRENTWNGGGLGSGPLRSGSQENSGRLGMGTISVFSAVTSQASSIFQDEVKRVGVFF